MEPTISTEMMGEFFDRYLIAKPLRVAVVGLGKAGIEIAQGIAHHENVKKLTLCGKVTEDYAAIEEKIRTSSASVFPTIETQWVIDEEIDVHGQPNLMNIDALLDNDCIIFTLGSGKRPFRQDSIRTLISAVPGIDPKRDYRMIDELCGSILPTLAFAKKVNEHRTHVKDQLFLFFNNPPELTAGMFAKMTGLYDRTAGLNHLCQYRLQQWVFAERYLTILQRIMGWKFHPIVWDTLKGFADNEGLCYGQHGNGIVPIRSTILNKAKHPLDFSVPGFERKYKDQMEQVVEQLALLVGGYAPFVKEEELATRKKGWEDRIHLLEEKIKALGQARSDSRLMTELDQELQTLQSFLERNYDATSTIRRQCDPAVHQVVSALTDATKPVFLALYGRLQEFMPEATHERLHTLLTKSRPIFFGTPAIGPFPLLTPVPVKDVAEDELTRIVAAYSKLERIDAQLTRWLEDEHLITTQPYVDVKKEMSPSLATIRDLRTRLLGNSAGTLKDFGSILRIVRVSVEQSRMEHGRLSDENAALRTEVTQLRAKVETTPALSGLECLAQHPEVFCIRENNHGSAWVINPKLIGCIFAQPGIDMITNDGNTVLGISDLAGDTGRESSYVWNLFPGIPRLMHRFRGRIIAAYPYNKSLVMFGWDGKRGSYELQVKTNHKVVSYDLGKTPLSISKPFEHQGAIGVYGFNGNVIRYLTFDDGILQEQTADLPFVIREIIPLDGATIVLDDDHNAYSIQKGPVTGHVKVNHVLNIGGTYQGLYDNTICLTSDQGIGIVNLLDGRTTTMPGSAECCAALSENFLYTGRGHTVTITRRLGNGSFSLQLPQEVSIESIHPIRGEHHGI